MTIALSAADARAAVSCAALATTCSADCDGDGQVAVSELIEAVGMAVGRTEGGCAAADFDGNGRVTIEELVAGVACALRGPPLAFANGTYDAQVWFGSDAPPMHGVGSIRPGYEGRLFIDLGLTQLEEFSLTARCAANGEMAIDGGFVSGGDILVGVYGSGRLQDLGASLRFAAVLEPRPVLEPVPFRIMIELERPKRSVSESYSEIYRITFHHTGVEGAGPFQSAAALRIDYTPDGMTCAETNERNEDGVVVASIGAGMCQVSPNRALVLFAPYTPVDSEGDLPPLRMSGSLSSAGGSFWIGWLPWACDEGVWTAERVED